CGIKDKCAWDEAVALQNSHKLKSNIIGVKACSREYSAYAEPPYKKLYKYRCATNNFSVYRGDPAKYSKAREAAHRTYKTKDGRQHHTDQRDHNGCSGSLQQNREINNDEITI